MFDFRDDGRIAIDLDDGQDPLVLSRIKYDQLRRLRLVLMEMQNDLATWAEENPEIERPDPPNADYRRASTERISSSNDQVASVLLRFWHLVVEGDNEMKRLGSRDLPLDGELPAALVASFEPVNKAFAHWQTGGNS